MPGAVTVGQLIVNLSANTADLKSDLASTTSTVKQSAQEMTNAWAGVTTSTGNVNAAGKALIATLKEQIATFGMTDQQLIQYKANLAGVGGEVQALNARLTGMKDAAAAYGEEAKKAGAHTEQFSLSTAGARRELIVLAHEMSQGNYSKFGGSLLVLAEQTNAASLLFSSTGLALGALAAVVALTGYELYKMHDEIYSFNKSIQLTGNFAGVTRDSLNSMATSIQSSATGGVRKATEVLEGLAATGHFTSGAMMATGESALQFARLTGKSSEDVVKFFDGMSNGVTAWAETANKSYHFLNAAQYEHIATLEKEGNSQQAVILAMNLMNAGLDENAKHLSYWQKNAQGWTMILDAASESMRKFAFPTIDEKVASQITKLNELQDKMRRMTANGTADSGPADQIRADIAKQRQVVHDLIAQSNKGEIDAAAKQERDLANLKAVAAQKDLDQIKTGLKTRDELRADAEAKIRKDADIINANAIANGKQIVETADDVARLVAASNAKYADKAVDDRGVQLNYALELEKANFQEQTGLYNERIKQLELYHSKFGLSDGAFYSGREAARAEYMQAAAAAYDKESDLVANFDNKNSKEEADSNRTLQKMFADYQKFVADMNGVASLDGANVLAAEQKAYDDMIAALDKAGQASLKSIDDQIAKEKKHALEIGHTKEQIDRLMQAQQDAATADLESQSNAIEDLLKQQDLNGVARGIYEEQLVQINAQIAARKELAGILGSNAVLQADADAAKKASEAWTSANKRIGDDLAGAIIDGGGKGVKKLIRDMELAFAKAVLSPILSPISGGIASILNPGAPQASSSLLGSIGSASSMYNGASTVAGWLGIGGAALGSGVALGTGALGTGAAVGAGALGSGVALGSGLLGSGAAATGALGSGVALGSGALGAGATSAGLLGGASAALAAIPVWGWAALAAAAVVSFMDSGPEQNTHLTFGSNNSAGNISINERGNEGKNSAYIDNYGTSSLGTFGVTNSFWMSSSSDVVQSFIKTVSQTDDALAAFMTTTEKASVSNYLTGKSDIAQTGAEGSNPNSIGALDKVFADRINNILDGVEPGLSKLESGFTGTSQQLATEAAALLQYRAALKDSGQALFGTEVTLQQIAALKQPTEATSAALTRVANEFQATNQVASMLGVDSAKAFGAAGLASEAARAQVILLSGGLSSFTSQASDYAQNFLSDAQRMAPVAKQLDVALGSLGLSTIPTTKDAFAALVDQLVSSGALATEQGAKQFAGLMAVESAFAQVHAEEAAAVRSAADIASERADLQKRLDDATMTQAQLADKARMAIDGHNLALYDQVQAAQAAKNAADEAKAAADALASANAGYQTQIDQLLAARQGEAAVRTLETAGMAGSTITLYDRLKALKAEDAATAASAPAATALASTNAGYQKQIDDLLKANMSAAQVRAMETKGMDASTVALYDRLAALHASADAEKLAADAIKQAQVSSAAAVQSFGNTLVSSMDAATNAAKAFRELNDSLLIGDSSSLSPEQKYAEAKRQFATADASHLQASETALLAASKAVNGSGIGYARDFAAVISRNSSEAVASDAYAASIPDAWRRFLANSAIGAHANGGVASGWSVVGEQGPELAHFAQPARIYTASQTREMMGGGSSDAAVRENTAVLRQVLAATVENTKHVRKTADIWTRVTRDGNSLKTST